MWVGHCLNIFLIVVSLSQASVFYTNEEQQQTQWLALSRKKMVQLQGQILSVLGLQKPAKPELALTINKLASGYMASLYKQIGDGEEDSLNPNFGFLGKNFDEELKFDFQAIQEDSHSSDTIISFVPYKEINIPNAAVPLELLFQLSNHFEGLQLVSAHLFFVLDHFTQSRILLKGYAGLHSPPVHGFSSANNSNLISLNITQIFKDWLQHPQDVQKLFVELTVGNGSANTSLEITQMHCFGVGFFVESEQDKLKRVKRNISEYMVVEEDWDEEEEDSIQESSPAFSESTSKPSVFSPFKSFTDRRCSLRSLYVDFKDLGWDGWVIAPTGYQADYCDGDCSFPLESSVTPTNHAIVQNLVHVLDEQRAQPAQCAPSALKSQSILFLNNQRNVVMRRYKKMRVKQCGCH